jgi:ferredoxin
MPKLTIKVDPDLCIGAASCVTIAPETFQLNEENKAYVLDHGKEPTPRTYERIIEVTEEEKENIILGAQSCPTLAVFVYDENGVQLFPDM